MGEMVYRTDAGTELKGEELDEIRKTGLKENIKNAFAIVGIVATGLFVYGMVRDRDNPEQDLNNE